MITINNKIPDTKSLSDRDKFKSFEKIGVGSSFLVKGKLHIIAQISSGIINLICITNFDTNRNANPVAWYEGNSEYKKLSYEVFMKMIKNYHNIDDMKKVNVEITITSFK